MHRILRGAGTLLALTCAGSAWATDPVQEQQEPEEQEVVVTASRYAQPISEAPAAVTVVDRKAIDNRNVSRITDALWATPGLFLGRGENGQSAVLEGGFSLRGMTTNRTLVLLDGLSPIQNGNSQGVNWLTIFPEDVERVEVVPGAFAALYGSNAIGGVVNTITKRPTEREVTVRLRKGFDDASGEWPSVYVRTPLGGGFGIAAGVAYNRHDGFVSQFIVRQPVAGAPGTPVTGAIPTTTREGVPSIIVGDRGREPWRQINAVIKAEWAISPDHRIYGGFGYADAIIDYAPFNTYLRNAAGAPVVTGTIGFNGQRYTVAENNFVGSAPLTESSRRYFGGYVGTFGAAEVRAEIARFNRDQETPTIGTGGTATGGPGTLSTAPNHSDDAALTVTVPIGARHRVVAGLNRHQDVVERRVFVLPNWRDTDVRTTINNGYDGRSTLSSAFLQDAWTPVDPLTLYLGARVDRWETRGRFFQNIAPVSNIAYPERSETSFNPKASAVLRPAGWATLRASYGRAFRTPSNLDLYSTTVSSSAISPTGILTVQSDPNLKPEHGSSKELGFDVRSGNRLRAFGSVYETRLTDFIATTQVNLSLSQRINIGRARVRGVEVGISARPVPWLTLDANASLIDSRVLENPTDPLSIGKRLTQVPRRIGYIGVTATPGKFVGVVEARYTDHIFITARNTDVVEGVPGGYDEYTLVNAKIGYKFDPKLRLNLSVNNVFDKDIFQFGLLAHRNVTVELVTSF